MAPIAVLTAAAWGQGRISAVEVTTLPGGLDVAVTGSNLSKPKELRILGGQSFIAEFDANLDMKGFRRRLSAAGVSSVEVGWYSARPPKVRVHLRLDPSAAPILFEEKGRWIIRVREEGARLTPTASNTLPPVGGTPANPGFPDAVPPLNPLPAAQPVKTTPAPKEEAPAGGSSVAPSQAGQPLKTTPMPKEDAPAGGSVVTPDRKGAAGTAPAPPEAKPLAGGSGIGGPALQPRPAAQPARPEKRINLEFVGADVVQVLRALSKEAGVNIVTAPDVSPTDKPSRITVSLNQVTVSDALSYVTVIANLRYAKLNNTFFVTKSENFATTMREFYKGDSSRFATRVASVPSAEGIQIRNAILAAYPQDGEGGFYDILDPESTGLAAPQAAAQAPAGQPAAGRQPQLDPDLPVWLGGAGPQTGPGGAAGRDANPSAGGRPRVSFLMLVGDPRKLDLIEGAIRELDSRISSSFSLARSDDMGAETVSIVSGQTTQIREMLEKLLEANPRRNAFTIRESGLRELTEGDLTTNVILMIGPKADIALLKQYAETLDENLARTAGIPYSREQGDLERIYEVVDLQYIEPIVASFDLKNRVRGLFVSTVPDPVTPGLRGEQKDEKTEQTNAPGTQPAGGQGGGQAAPAAEATNKDELNKSIGREPMRLVLRGTRQQIEAAKQYLALVDLPPRQAAFEIRVMEMTREEATRFGLDWSLITGGRLTRLSSFQNVGDAAGVSGTNSGNYRFRGSDAVSWIATLDKMDDGRRIISRPNALLSDARPWNMFVGDTIRYIESIQSTQNGVTIQTGSVDVGVTANLLGRFGGDGSIALEVEQIYNILNSFTPVPGGGQLPQTSERRIRSTINMKAGEVIAFGGLIHEITRRNVSGIPLLMDIPILGQLFRRSVKEKDRTELVFIIAAIEVTPANRPDAASPRRSETETPDPAKLYQRNEIRNGKP